VIFEAEGTFQSFGQNHVSNVTLADVVDNPCPGALLEAPGPVSCIDNTTLPCLGQCMDWSVNGQCLALQATTPVPTNEPTAMPMPQIASPEAPSGIADDLLESGAAQSSLQLIMQASLYNLAFCLFLANG